MVNWRIWAADNLVFWGSVDDIIENPIMQTLIDTQADKLEAIAASDDQATAFREQMATDTEFRHASIDATTQSGIGNLQDLLSVLQKDAQSDLADLQEQDNLSPEQTAEVNNLTDQIAQFDMINGIIGNSVTQSMVTGNPAQANSFLKDMSDVVLDDDGLSAAERNTLLKNHPEFVNQAIQIGVNDVTGLASLAKTFEGNEQLAAAAEVLENPMVTQMLSTPEGKAQVSGFLQDYTGKLANDGQVTPQERTELQQNHPELVQTVANLAVQEIDAGGQYAERLAESVGTLTGDETLTQEIQQGLELADDPFLKGFITQNANAQALLQGVVGDAIAGTAGVNTALDRINGNPAVAKDFVQEAIANPDGFKGLVDKAMEDNTGASSTTQFDIEKYPGIKNAMIDIAVADPKGLGTLIEKAELGALSADIAQVQEALPILENKFVQDIVQGNPELAYHMADPKYKDNYQQALEDYIESDPSILAKAQASLKANMAEAEALAPMVGNAQAQAQYKIMLEQFASMEAAEISAISTNVAAGQSMTMAVTGAVIDPIITLASNKTNPDAFKQAGEQFVDVLADKLGNDAAVQASAAELKADERLMQHIGNSFAEQGPALKAMVPAFIDNPDKAFETLLQKHPHMLDVAVPMLASANPDGVRGMAMEGIESGLLKSIENFSPEDKLAAKASIEELMMSLEGNQAFQNSLINNLSDVDKAANILDNMTMVAGRGGNLESLQSSIDKFQSNPENILAAMSSDKMVAYLGAQYAGEITSKMKLGGMETLQERLANAANDPSLKKMKEMTGIDFGGMLTGLSDMLPGFGEKVEGAAQHYGAWAGVNNLNFQVTNSWMGGFDMGGNMKTGDNLFSGILDRFTKQGSGMFLTNTAQLGFTNGVGGINVAGMEGWAENQKRTVSGDTFVDENGKEWYTWTNPDGTTGKVDPYIKDEAEMERQMAAQGWGKNSVASSSGFSKPGGTQQVAQANQESANDGTQLDPTGTTMG